MSVMLLTEEHRNSQASVNTDFSPGFRCTVLDQVSPTRPGLYRAVRPALLLSFCITCHSEVCTCAKKQSLFSALTVHFIHTRIIQMWDYKHFCKINK